MRVLAVKKRKRNTGLMERVELNTLYGWCHTESGRLTVFLLVTSVDVVIEAR